MNLEITETIQEGEEKMDKIGYERKAIPPKIRFEILKRDKYTCQYCGRKAPDVILEIEHITPVVKGGTNDPTNLMVACKDCNIGKFDTLLDDNTLIENQYKEIINQSDNIKKIKKMHMLKKFNDLNKDKECKILEEDLLRIHGIKLDENGRKNIKRIIRKYGIMQIFETLDGLYARDLNDNVNFNVFLKQLKYDYKIKEKPYLKDAYYIRKILINNCNIISPIKKNELLKFIEAKLLDNYDKESLKQYAMASRNVNYFYRLVEQNKRE